MGVSERQRKDKEGFSRATIEGSLLSDIRESKGQEKGEMEREREREHVSELDNQGRERGSTPKREKTKTESRKNDWMLLPLLNYSTFYSVSCLCRRFLETVITNIYEWMKQPTSDPLNDVAEGYNMQGNSLGWSAVHAVLRLLLCLACFYIFEKATQQ
jgi:hypothetical protein